MKPHELRRLAVRLRRDRARTGSAALDWREAHVVADALQVVAAGLTTWPADVVRPLFDALRDPRDVRPEGAPDA